MLELVFFIRVCSPFEYTIEKKGKIRLSDSIYRPSVVCSTFGYSIADYTIDWNGNKHKLFHDNFPNRLTDTHLHIPNDGQSAVTLIEKTTAMITKPLVKWKTMKMAMAIIIEQNNKIKLIPK